MGATIAQWDGGPGMSVPYPVKSALAHRSRDRCAMPSYHRVLSEPRDDERVILGEVAHIRGRVERRRAGTPFGPIRRPKDRGGG